MGHMVGKDVYVALGEKVDGLHTRSPNNKELFAILRELYSHDEAELVAKMPYSLANFERIQKVTQIEPTALRKLLDDLTSKGLIMDLHLNDEYLYAPNPMVIGIFEFTMMRSGADADPKKWARLLDAYMHGNNGSFFAANARKGDKVSVSRVVPHEEAVHDNEYTEILDHDKAAEIIKGSDKIAVGMCSCRHQKSHLGKACDAPMDTCTSFGPGAEYLIRHDLAREVSQSEMLDKLDESIEKRLVITADNMKNKPMFMCHCCGCCCHLMLGVSKFGYTNTVVTSKYEATIDFDKCNYCQKCVKACPIGCIGTVPMSEPGVKAKRKPRVDLEQCIGCGVCNYSCKEEAIKLTGREQKVLLPENSFERVVLQSLEKGTLQNQFLDNPQSESQRYLRYFLGAFLRLTPVKKALMSDQLRSRFLGALKAGVKMQGKGDLLQL